MSDVALACWLRKVELDFKPWDGADDVLHVLRDELASTREVAVLRKEALETSGTWEPDAAEGKRTEEELIAFCREHLAHFKCPRSIDVLEMLPRNPTGKILKRDLRQPYWDGRSRQVN